MKIIFTLGLLVISSLAQSSSIAVDELLSYDATYTITRDNKPTAEQHTKLTRQANNQYTLKDTTKGTHGLASFTGFERQEKSTFMLSGENILVSQHNMKQEVAFSKKTFRFNTDPQSNTITGKHKKPFNLTTDLNPISTHLLPIWLSAKVCNGETSITLPVLKSNHIKTYHFNVVLDQQNLIRAERIYPPTSEKSTQIWFDINRQCLPIKTLHKDGNEPVIETKLKSFTLRLDKKT